MIEITPEVSLDEAELHFDYIRSSGPGGQNVNKVATAVQLRWDVAGTIALTPEVKLRLRRLAGSRVTDDGILLIEAKRYRTQEKNRLDAINRLVIIVQQALVPPKTRRATRPTVSARAARVSDKKKRGETKRIRKYNPEEWE